MLLMHPTFDCDHRNHRNSDATLFHGTHPHPFQMKTDQLQGITQSKQHLSGWRQFWNQKVQRDFNGSCSTLKAILYLFVTLSLSPRPSELVLPRSVPDEEAKMPAEGGPDGAWLKVPGKTPVGVGGVEPHPPIGKEL